MDTIIGDPLFLVIKDLDYKSITNLCSTNSHYKNFCEKNEFRIWSYLVLRDFPKAYLVMKDKKINWKHYYKYILDVSDNKVIWSIYQTQYLDLNFFNKKWENVSGMFPNDLNGWTLRKDVNNSRNLYIYPATYGSIQGPRLTEDERHPQIMIKLTTPSLTIEDILWNSQVLGDSIHYRRGNGIVEWYDDSYLYKFKFDGMKKELTIFVDKQVLESPDLLEKFLQL